MRGDSLRDLYAKALAVLGLGMLAGAGALVDFWPTDSQGPRIASGLSRPLAAAPLTFNGAVTVPSATIVSNRRAETLPVAIERVAAEAPSIPVDAPAIAVNGSPVGLSVPEVASDTPPQEAGTPASEDVNAPAPAYEFPASSVRMAPVSDTSADSGDGFLTTTFKKTGASIRKGGAKTGASIFDAFRAIGGAVRKAFPG